jgi:hypothetical protein
MAGWEQIFIIAAEAATKTVVTKVAGEASEYLLLQLSGQQAIQREVLQLLRQDIRALMEGPWHTGDRYLFDAANDSSIERRQKHIEDASSEFRRAHGYLEAHERAAQNRSDLPPDHFFSRALIEARIALCALCLDELTIAHVWFKDANQSARLAGNELERLIGHHLRRQEFVDKSYHFMSKTYDTVRKGGAITLGAGVLGGLFFPPVGMAAAVAVTLGGVGIAALGAAAKGVAAYEQLVLRSPQAAQQLLLLREVKAFLKALPQLNVW